MSAFGVVCADLDSGYSIDTMKFISVGTQADLALTLFAFIYPIVRSNARRKPVLYSTVEYALYIFGFWVIYGMCAQLQSSFGWYRPLGQQWLVSCEPFGRAETAFFWNQMNVWAVPDIFLVTTVPFLVSALVLGWLGVKKEFWNWRLAVILLVCFLGRCISEVALNRQTDEQLLVNCSIMFLSIVVQLGIAKILTKFVPSVFDDRLEAFPRRGFSRSLSSVDNEYGEI